MKESFFMLDQSKGSHGIEKLIDYQLSWVMRIPANPNIKKQKPILYKNCRSILFQLMGCDDHNQLVKSVAVKKQWKRIDLIAEVVIEKDNIEKNYVIVQEHKAYTPIHDNQLVRYKTIIDEHYDSKQWGEERVFNVFTIAEPNTNLYHKIETACQDAGWKLICYEDLQFPIKPDTESDLFNEFWLRSW